MRRSVLLRFLGLSLAVALGAVIATAVIATYSTSETLQGEIDQNTSQLQVDGDIYGKLNTYAADHATWSGVGELVNSLSDKTGRRIALTDADGTVIADSARTLGAGPELPSLPAATVDARAGVGGLFAAAPIGTNAGRAETAATTRAVIAAGGGGQLISSRMAGSPEWGMTEEEKRQRNELAAKAVACWQAQGKNGQAITNPGGAPLLTWQATTPNGVNVMQVPEVNGDPCVPAGLSAPSAKAAAVNRDEIRRATECLTSAGEPFDLIGDSPDKLQAVAPRGGNTEEMSETFINCVSTARTAALTPYVAPEAKLYLGAKSAFNVFSGEGLARTAATALGVLLIAALVMVFAGRRLVRPILALTGAAQRMTNGDHAARVPVNGRDEVARLGHAFNAMAESIQHHDHQRKAMVSDVAHELRTPLANIKGYLVASEDGVVPLDQELVTSLLEEAGLLERLIADLQDLALADAGKLRIHPELRDLSELAQQVVSAHRPAAEAAGITLIAEVNGPAPAVVDNARIRQSLGNLVSNAIRFTPADGTVLVGVRRVGDGYKLTVTDNGTGIAAEDLPHLFDRFYRAEHSRSRTTGGSGLGLAITKHLVEAHRGTISATSRLGHGSTFTIQLPARGN
ncbi:sensor histidine kinase [Kribbella catacumbae]|uniref:sensor histidine kinase n=1 Tax=Kribbella catacumbae TaxID=460086 RepID=UPI00037747BF|nr:HAMP domain-containing sensor histidine kinase [Kribbella catacumbae]